MKDNYALLREVQQGFARVKAQQGTQSSSSLEKSIRDHFGLRKSDVDPTEDEEFAQRRLKQARANSRSQGLDPDLGEATEDTGVPTYGEAPVMPHPDEEPLFVPTYLRVPGGWWDALSGAAQEKVRQDVRRPNIKATRCHRSR
jgi:hypothetical protein